MSLQEYRTQVGGKWSSGDSLDEQVESAELVSEFLDFDSDYNYTDNNIESSEQSTAVVRGFWVEESQSSSYDWRFAVNMELRGENTEMVTVKFAFKKNEPEQNWELKQFLKVFGVDSHNIESILGRKCLYEDLRTEEFENNGLSIGLHFYNTSRTYLSGLQKILTIMIGGSFGISLLQFMNMGSMLVGSLALLFALSGGVVSIDPYYRKFNSHHMISVKNYAIE